MNYLHERELPLEQMMPLIKERLSEGGSIKISPKGISMLPMLRQGKDSVVLSPLPGRLNKYDLPLYQRNDGKYILHRIIRVDNNYTCMGDNQLSAERVEHSQLIAYVTAFYRGEKLYSVKNPVYRFYCLVWCNNIKLRRFVFRGKNWIIRHFRNNKNI